MTGSEAKKIADTTLDIGKRIWIKVFGIKFPFYLKPLRVDTMIALSPYASFVKRVTKESVSIHINENAVPISKYIAISLLNKPWKIMLFTKILARSVRAMIPSEQLVLLQNAESRYETNSFFLCVALVQRASIILNGEENSREEKPSGDESQSDKKSSTKAGKKS